VGAGIGGRGGEVLIVDDPIKDAAEAGSDVVRKGIWDWFTSTLYTRAMPGGGIVVIMTRWHEADLAGILIENARKDGEDWQIVRFPAIAEEDEVSAIDGKLLRKEGEALHPERYSLEALAKIKVAVGSRVWASLYQQRPSAAEGNKFKREDWRYFKPTYDANNLGDREEFRMWCDAVGITQIIQRWDTALGEKKTDDYTACTTLGIGKNKYYVLEVWKKKIEFPEVKREIVTRYEKWRPAKVFVEGGGSASGKASVQAIKRDSVVPIFESITTTDKELRADTVTPAHEAGLIALPEGSEWVADFVDQCSNFPNATKDDDVDSFIGAMEEALGNPGPMIITDEFLAAVGAL
jgi:predicted phage terminase large subunit-like protein